jgi:hypothetical protein
VGGERDKNKDKRKETMKVAEKEFTRGSRKGKEIVNCCINFSQYF